LALNVKGLINIQFAIQRFSETDYKIYILEVNPRASRTVPFVAKVTGVPVASLAAKVMAGIKLKQLKPKNAVFDYVAIKEAVFPFSRFPGTDILLGPEMRSTGEVMGIDNDFATAFYKAQLGAGSILPTSGTVFLSVRDSDKNEIVASARQLIQAGFDLVATKGTAQYLQNQGIDVAIVNKVMEGRPNIADLMTDKKISMVINTVEGVQSISDSLPIRTTALTQKIPHYTTISGAKAAVLAIIKIKESDFTVSSIQEFHKKII
jgi:carbamoyl-phosphate synthase large subunit